MDECPCSRSIAIGYAEEVEGDCRFCLHSMMVHGPSGCHHMETTERPVITHTDK